MTDREAMQQALDALDRVMSHGSAVQEVKDILRERLEQPQPEPVIDKSAAIRIATALGWKPRQWVGLTDEEIRFIAWGDFGVDQEKHLAEVLPLARAIEAKLREKNT